MNRTLLGLFAAGSLATAALAFAEPAPATKPTSAKICTNCHKAEPNTLRGTFDNVAFKAKTIQLRMDDAVELLKFDEDEIKVTTAEGKAMDGDALHKTKKGHEIKIEYTEANGIKTAVRLVEKPPVKLPPEMMISKAEVEKLVAQGPEKGRYYLFDSRPLPRFQEGAIPTAINLPYPAFDKMVDKLPADKNSLIIFYCAGINCNMSPGSAEKANKLGYTNIKVFREGVPAWSEKNYTVLSPQSLKEAWLGKGVPHVLLDVRPAKEAAIAHIKGAVTFPAGQAGKLIKNLPPKDKKPPVIIYDAGDGKQAAKVAKALVKVGYNNVKVVTGGMAAWKTANYELSSGKLVAKATYTPKPRQGEIDMEEFKKYAAQLPPNVMIIDVRNADEVSKGMLNTAKNIPAEEIKARVAEIPKDKLVVTQCSTGVRAEMAYHALKELGYTSVKFLNGKVDYNKDGSYNISKD